MASSLPSEVLNSMTLWNCLVSYCTDALTLAVLGGMSLGIWYIPPVPNHLFPLHDHNGSIVDPSIGYPIVKPLMPHWVTSVIPNVLPQFVFGIIFCKTRSVFDFFSAHLGLGFALLQACTFQVILKTLIGGLRPHFLEACKPRITGDGAGSGFDNMYYRVHAVCTGDIKEALESFPSGHTTAVFAGFTYLSLYLNAKLKILSDRRVPLWVALLSTIPLLSAWLLAGVMLIEKWHHWYDLAVGALIGTLSALMAFRMTYASVWNWRYNHIPLSKRYCMTYSPDDPMVRSYATAVWAAPSIEPREADPHEGRQLQRARTGQDPESGEKSRPSAQGVASQEQLAVSESAGEDAEAVGSG